MDLVAPIIPNAQENKGPELFASSFGTGLAAMARFSEMKRNSDMQLLKIAENEKLAQEQNALEREKMATDADIRRSALDSTMKLNEAHADYFRAHAKAYSDNTATATQRAIAFNQQRESLVNEVNDQASKLKLDDPDFATKQPVQFAANVNQFEDMYGLSPLPEVKGAIHRYRTLADQQKIPLKIGATFDEEKGTWVGGKESSVPIWQIARNMKDPDQQEETANALQASGHMKLIQDFEEIAGKKVPRTRSEPDDLVKNALKEGESVNFQRVPSRVPSAMLPKSAGPGTAGPTDLPEPYLPPVVDEPQARNVPQFDPTQTDTYISQARAAIAKGAPMAAVARRLQEMSIDPQVLFAT